MLDRALDRMSGRINEHIHNRAVRRLPDLVRDLLERAFTAWSANGWHTFDRAEVNCSCQLFRWMIAARRSDRSFYPLEVNIENILITPAMLNGTETVTRAKRPDLRISVRGGGVLLEAKRLTNTANNCRAYVHDGMARFVSSTYGVDDDWGIMVGYVQENSTAGLQSHVNRYVNAHSMMGSGHRLMHETTNTNSEWLSSSHPRASNFTIRLEHVWVVLPKT